MFRNLVFVLACVAASLAPAQESATATSAAPAPAGNADELAKQLSNPVANLISVPFQFNYDGSIGPEDAGDKYYLNVQPVIPVKISDNWNMISRTIAPLIYQKNVVPDDHEFGFGDISQSFFFTPKPKGGFIWALGPAALLPTATDDQLGTGKFGLGPTGLALYEHKHITAGILANHIWSVAGEGDRAEISSTFMQPFLAYHAKGAWTFTLQTETIYDWNREQWSVPINGMVSKTLHLGKQPISIGGGVRYWADTFDGGPEGFGGRFVITLLFPKK